MWPSRNASVVSAGFRGVIRSIFAPALTEESIAAFKKRYVSLLSIARTTNSASWALQNLCKRCNLSMLVAGQPGKKRSQAFIRAEQRQELLSLRSKAEGAIS